MSNIRQFPNGKEISSQQKIKEELFRRFRTRMYTILAIVLLIAIAVISYLTYEKTKVYTAVEVSDSILFNVIPGAVVSDFDGNILVYSNDGANVTDAKGNLLWNITFDMQNPMMDMCGKTVAFADYGGSMIYVRTSGGEGYEVDTDMPIRKIATSDNGIVAAVLEDVGVTWIYVYDMNGKILVQSRTTMEKSGYPVALTLSPSGEVMGVSYYYMDIGDVKSSIAFYNFGEVGQNNIDNYVSGYNYKDSLVPSLHFLSDNYAFALSGERLNVYEGAHKPLSIKDAFLTDDVISVYHDDAHIALIYRNKESSDMYKLEIYSEKSELLNTQTFNFDYTGIAFGSDQYAIYGNSDICVSTYSGKTKLSTTYDKAIRLVVPTSSSTKFVLVTDTSVDTVTLK